MLPQEEGCLTKTRVRDGAVAACYLLAFLSGTAALVYEVTWAKMLALTFGSTTLSAAAVFAGFLGGMGIGAALYHRLPGHASRPLLLYAWIELGIAVSAALLSSTFYALPERFADLSRLVDQPALLVALRLALVLALLLVPAALMGATFPALCRALIDSARGVDLRLGWIYGINTLGAAFGTVLAGLFLIERLGLRNTSLVANGINLVVALAAFALQRGRSTVEPSVVADPADAAIPTSLPRATTGFVLVLSGFCTLGYEILWFRGLRYLVGASTYAFSIVLFTFLCGLGLGSLLLRRAAERKAPEHDLVIVQCAVAVLALGGIALQALLLSQPALYKHLSIFVPAVRLGSWQWRLVLDAGVAMLTLLPATIFMGLSFPLATRLFLGDVRRLDTRVGSAYLLANLGSIAGAIAGAVLLLPYLGTIGGTKLCAGLNLLAAVAIAAAVRGSHALPLAIASAIVLTLSTFLPRSLELYGEDYFQEPRPQRVFFEEGDLATVKVQRDPQNHARLEMSIDGYKIGWSAGFRGTPVHQKQILLADLPLVLDRRVRRTLSIGLGSGATLAELGRDPRLETLDCIEINAAVVRAAQLFPEWRVVSDRRARLFVEDAVHYLLRSDDVYDLIVSDGKQDPFFAGNADLLCLEFYRYARARLTPSGMLVQWFPLGTLPSDLRTVIATLCAAFPEVDVFSFPPFSLLVVASVEPLSARPPLGEQEFASLPVGESLRGYGLGAPGAVLSHWVAGRDRLVTAVSGDPVSRWDRQILDVSPFLARGEEWTDAVPENIEWLISLEEPLSKSAGPALALGDEHRLAATRTVSRAWLATLRERIDEALGLFRRALELDPSHSPARAMVHRLQAERPAPR